MVQTHVKFLLGCPAKNCKIWAMQLRIFRRVTASLLRHSLYTRCHFNTLAPATEIGGIKPLISRQSCWHGLGKEMLDACAPPTRQPEELRKLIEAAKMPPAKKREMSPRRKPDEMGRWLCNRCGQMLFAEEFSQRLKAALPPATCRECERNGYLLYARTLRGAWKTSITMPGKGPKRKGWSLTCLSQSLLACWSCKVVSVRILASAWKWSSQTATGECHLSGLTITWGTQHQIAFWLLLSLIPVISVGQEMLTPRVFSELRSGPFAKFRKWADCEAKASVSMSSWSILKMPEEVQTNWDDPKLLGAVLLRTMTCDSHMDIKRQND